MFQKKANKFFFKSHILWKSMGKIKLLIILQDNIFIKNQCQHCEFSKLCDFAAFWVDLGQKNFLNYIFNFKTKIVFDRGRERPNQSQKAQKTCIIKIEPN